MRTMTIAFVVVTTVLSGCSQPKALYGADLCFQSLMYSIKGYGQSRHGSYLDTKCATGIETRLKERR